MSVKYTYIKYNYKINIFNIIRNMFGEPIDDLLKEFYSQHKAVILGSLASSITTYTIESVILPKIIAHLLTNVSDKEALKYSIIKIIVSWGTVQASYAINEVLNSKIEPLLTKFITDKLINSVFVKYETTHSKIDTSIIFSNIVSLRSNIESLFDRVFLVLVPRVISIIIIIINFYIINPKIGQCSLMIIILQILLICKDIKKCVAMSFDEMEGKDFVIESIGDKFDNIHTISSIKNGIEKELVNCKTLSKEMMEKRLKSNACVINKQVLGYVSNTAVFSIIMLYTYYLYVHDEVNSEQLATVLLSMNTLFNHMYEITYYIPDLTRKFGILDANKKFASQLFAYKPKLGIDVLPPNGNIKFDKVSFAYKSKNNDAHIFKNLVITVKSGKTVALFGPSGSGKSTFVKLILGILQPVSGKIYVGGIDISTMSSNSIKNSITYVSQNTSTLFNNTIYYNLVYGYEDVPNIKNIITNLFDKYELYDIFKNINNNADDRYNFFNYNVGKTGEILSGGQRQVIHLIRSVLNNNSVVYIYDEPTSALDIANKNSVLQLIKNEVKGKTVLIIAHDNDVKRISDETIDFSIFSTH